MVATQSRVRALPGSFAPDSSDDEDLCWSRAEAEAFNLAIVGPSNVSHKLEALSLDDSALNISLLTGFLPDFCPATRLEGPAAIWEDVWDVGRRISLEDVSKHAIRWRKWVEKLKVVDTGYLESSPQLQRAHALLAYLVHRYVRSLPASKAVPRVPDSLGIPFLQVSHTLDMPPVLTYAECMLCLRFMGCRANYMLSTVLWNWRLKDPHAGFTWENLDILLSFTNTPSERHFYLVSALVEYVGAPALRIMSAVLDEAHLNDATSRLRIINDLLALAPHIDACTRVLKATRIGCEPAVFYNEIRPWFNGGERIFADQLLDWGGPSAGQSTLVHAFDVFLGIDHIADDETAEASFMLRMQDYMPLGHRIFLRHLGPEARLVRQLAAENKPVKAAYDTCIEAMKRLREEHMRIVGTYIMRFARSTGQQAKGTGGSNIQSFLGRTRTATMRALLSET